MLGSARTVESGIKVSSRILERYLLRGESVVVANRQHWAKLSEPAATVLLGFLVVAWLGSVIERATDSPALWLWWGWLALVARLGWKLLEWRNEWFVATDKRLLMTYGLFTHRVAMMPLRKVTDMNYGRPVIGRVLGYGTFTLESAGQDQAMHRISWVPHPDDTYREICEIIFGPGGHDGEEDLAEPEDEEDQSAGGEPRGRDEDPGWEISPPRRRGGGGRDVTGPLPRR